MNAHGCFRGRAHQFDEISGWCDRGCGVRDDGRVIDRAGNVVFPGPPMSPERLDAHRTKITAILAERARLSAAPLDETSEAASVPSQNTGVGRDS